MSRNKATESQASTDSMDTVTPDASAIVSASGISSFILRLFGATQTSAATAAKAQASANSPHRSTENKAVSPTRSSSASTMAAVTSTQAKAPKKKPKLPPSVSQSVPSIYCREFDLSFLMKDFLPQQVPGHSDSDRHGPVKPRSHSAAHNKQGYDSKAQHDMRHSEDLLSNHRINEYASAKVSRPRNATYAHSSDLRNMDVTKNRRSITEDEVTEDRWMGGLLQKLRPSNNDLGDGKDFWMKDETSKECYQCNTVFTTFRRKHHCRVCGELYIFF